MTIYRGPGGTGESTSDLDNTEFQVLLNQAVAAKDAAEVAAEVSNQNKLLREKFEEMHLTLGDTFSLTLQSMNTQLESVSAYKYYKNAYNAEKKLLKAKLNE